MNTSMTNLLAFFIPFVLTSVTTYASVKLGWFERKPWVAVAAIVLSIVASCIIFEYVAPHVPGTLSREPQGFPASLHPGSASHSTEELPR